MGLWIATAVVVGVGIGVALAAALQRFWDGIANWLNSTAADAVERALGYNARQYMLRATAAVTKVFDKLNNKTVIYTRQSALATDIQKVTLSSTGLLSDQEDEVRKKFEEEQTLINDYTYNLNA